MAIARVDAFGLACRLPRPVGDGRGLQPRVERMLVRVTDSDGVEGWGEGWPVVSGVPQVRRVAPDLVGRDPAQVAPIHDLLRRHGLNSAVLGAVDIALWDLNARRQGVSVATLLGGARRERVPAYASLHNYSETADLTAELTDLVTQARTAGFGGLKLKIGGRPPAEDARYLRAARAAAGDHMELMADANQTYDAPLAVSVGRLLEDLNYRWYEEPLPRHDVAGYAQLVTGLDIGIAGGEGAHSLADVLALCTARAIQISQPDVSIVGGFTVARHLPTLAQLFGVMPTWHVWNAGLVHVATLHLLASQAWWRDGAMAPEAPPLETTIMPNAMREMMFAQPLTLGSDGCYAVPSGPGLGVTINPDVLTRFKLDA